VRIVIIVAFALFWIVGQILTATRKKSPQQDQPVADNPPPPMQSPMDEDSLRELEEIARRRERMSQQRSPEFDSQSGSESVVIQQQETRRQRQLREQKLQRQTVEREARELESQQKAQALQKRRDQLLRQPMPAGPVFPQAGSSDDAYEVERRPVNPSSSSSAPATSSTQSQKRADEVSAALRIRGLMMGKSLKDALLVNEVLNKPKALRDE
jgi:hypothetical protein